MKTEHNEALVERVARIIDPTAWQLRDELRRTAALPKADAPPEELTSRATAQCEPKIALSIEKARAALEALPAPDEAVPASGGKERKVSSHLGDWHGAYPAAALASSTPDESLSLTRDDQRLLERALMASTEKVYDIATPAESARGGVVAKAADEMANVCKARASVIPPSRPA